jgi:diguanylate cyclase (GGDEF)-like protein
MTIPVGERVSGWAAMQRSAVAGRDHVTPLERDGCRSDLEDWDNDREMASLKSSIAAPIVGEDGLLGVVTLYDEVDRVFTSDERRILVRIAGYMAQVATREDRQTSADRTSLTDPLTGVPNARFLWLESAHRMGRPSGQGFGLIALRIGGLERVNQKSGNAAVDRLLCQVARRLASNGLDGETLVRFGQDMFVVLTRVHEPGELVGRWHEMAAAIEQPLLDARNGDVHRVRPSGAHASYPADGDNLDTLMEVLDTRLRFASRHGRTVLPFRLPVAQV